MHHLSDTELVERYRAAGGSPEGERYVNELFGRHYRRVAAWCYRLAGDRESAADLAQDVFEKAYRSLGSFRGDSRFTTWLYAIARNHCFNQCKAMSSRPAQVGEEFLEELEDASGEDLHARLERKDRIELVRRLIRATLDQTETRVLALHYGQELTLDAVTRLLDLKNPSGAKAYVVSARRKLAAALDRWKRGQPVEEKT